MIKIVSTIFAFCSYPLISVFADCTGSENCTYIDIASGSDIAVIFHDLAYVGGVVSFLLLFVGGFQLASWFFKR